MEGGVRATTTSPADRELIAGAANSVDASASAGRARRTCESRAKPCVQAPQPVHQPRTKSNIQRSSITQRFYSSFRLRAIAAEFRIKIVHSFSRSRYDQPA